jgi:hypothetical protein
MQMSYEMGYDDGGYGAYSNKGGSVDVTDKAALRAAMTGGSKPPAAKPAAPAAAAPKRAVPPPPPPAPAKKKFPIVLIVIWLAATVGISLAVYKYAPKITKR